VLYGRDLCCSGGTGKAEAAKLPGAGIGPKPCPEKCTAEKRMLTKLGENRSRNASTSATTVGGGENRSYRSPPQVRRVSGVKRIGNLGHYSVAPKNYDASSRKLLQGEGVGCFGNGLVVGDVISVEKITEFLARDCYNDIMSLATGEMQF